MNFKQLSLITDIWEALAGEGAEALLSTHYGDDVASIRERRDLILETLEAFRRCFPGETHAAILRIPARVNLMGVHIDHRGGWCNYLPIVRETLFCFSPRTDDRVVARNTSPNYSDYEFSISSELPPEARGDWLNFIETVELRRGYWGNYLKAGALKLQDRFPETALRGFNLVAGGDVPPRAGLSSSSTIVVGAALAIRAVNSLPLSNADLVELCGEGEWYVGTRGGAGDHSALLLGRLGSITHTGFKPLTFEYCPFPKGYAVVLAQCGVEAGKATQARETFNSRIAAYESAFAIYKAAHPQWSDRLEFLRDISPERLDLELPEFYHALKSVPVSATRDELNAVYPALQETFGRIVATYGEPRFALPLREALLFGVCECDRAKRFASLLREGNIDEAGALMYVSHDGDRISDWTGGESHPYRSPYDDAWLDRVTMDAGREPENPLFRPAWQPGGYRCSIEELDRLVDCCKTIEGVAGAGLTGAGLGGAILALVKEEVTDTAIETLKQTIAQWKEGEPFVERCRLAGGAALIEIL